MKDRPHRRSAGDAKRRPLKPKATSLSARLRILVVEGNANMREGLEAYFSLLGYRAHLTADVASALHLGFPGTLVGSGVLTPGGPPSTFTRRHGGRRRSQRKNQFIFSNIGP
jgi:hypothetical protein